MLEGQCHCVAVAAFSADNFFLLLQLYALPWKHMPS